MQKNCPCGSKLTLDQCCGPFIRGEKMPETPEQLMRSRYAAYTLANINYISKTMCGKAKVNFKARDAEKWARAATWFGLKVIRSYFDPQNNNVGFVEFIASYTLNNKNESIHEISEFHKIDGKWFYVAGTYKP
jgi:SEC-C motif domain protein